jgi:hypothetical protein
MICVSKQSNITSVEEITRDEGGLKASKVRTVRLSNVIKVEARFTLGRFKGYYYGRKAYLRQTSLFGHLPQPSYTLEQSN